MHRPRRQIDPARRDDPIYMAHESALMAQEFLLMTYGLTHFEPEIHLPIAKNNPDDPGIRQMCDALRRLMREAASESFIVFVVIMLTSWPTQRLEKYVR
jgi:hypothetical protein